MPLIYKKTNKGLAEIETRAQRLAPRLRSLLIVVDGKRDVDAIRALVQQPTDDALQALELQGFVEVVGNSTAAAKTATPAASSAAPNVAASANPSARAAVTGPAPAASGVIPLHADNFNALRSQAVRALLDAVGPAGDGLAMRLEKARSAPELQPLLVHAARLVAELGGRAAGERFTARFLTGG